MPLTRCHLGIIPYHSFDLDRRIELLQRLESADFVLIDSPTNPATREHTLVTVLQHTKPGALILLDDLEVRSTRRFAERLSRDKRHHVRLLRGADRQGPRALPEEEHGAHRLSSHAPGNGWRVVEALVAFWFSRAVSFKEQLASP